MNTDELVINTDIQKNESPIENKENNNNDNLSLNTSKSNKSVRTNKSSSKSKKSVKKPYYESISEDISLSDLDVLANKKKLSKKSTEVSISDIVSEQKKEESDRKSSSSSTKSSTRSYRKKKNVNENENEEVRREKSELLYKFSKLNANGKLSSLQFDMNSPLIEIKTEYERIRNQLQSERSVKFLQRMLLLGVQGIEMLNTKFDPMGVDLDGWSEAMAYSLENQEYDEVLQELYEKYKGKGQMAPETKFIFMIVSSAAMFAITKKLTKSDNGLGGLLGSLGPMLNKMQTQPQMPPQQPPQFQQKQMYQQQQPQPQPMQMSQQFQQQSQPQVQNVYRINPVGHTMQMPSIPMANTLKANQHAQQYDNSTDTSEDLEPSKLRGPNDDDEIQRILQKMNENKSKQNVETESDQQMIMKSISMNQGIPKVRKRGRPAKNIAKRR